MSAANLIDQTVAGAKRVQEALLGLVNTLDSKSATRKASQGVGVKLMQIEFQAQTMKEMAQPQTPADERRKYFEEWHKTATAAVTEFGALLAACAQNQMGNSVMLLTPQQRVVQAIADALQKLRDM